MPTLSAALALAVSRERAPWQQTPATVVRHGNYCSNVCIGWHHTHCARWALHCANLPHHGNLHCRRWAVSGCACYYV